MFQYLRSISQSNKQTNASGSSGSTLTISTAAPVALVACYVGCHVMWTKWKRRNARYRVAYVRERMIDEQLERLIAHTSGVQLRHDVPVEEVWTPVASIVTKLLNVNSRKIFQHSNSATPQDGVSLVTSPTITTNESTDANLTARSPLLIIPNHVLIPLNRIPTGRSAPPLISSKESDVVMMDSDPTEQQRAVVVTDVLELTASLLDLTLQHRSSLPIVDSTFLTSYAELFSSGVAPLDVLVDCWNVLSACLHQFLLAIAITDATSVSEGGTGELVNSWDSVLATAEILWERYNIFMDERIASCVRKSLPTESGGLFFCSSLRLWILPLDMTLLRHVTNIVNYRQGIAPAVQQTAQLLRKTCSPRRLLFLGGAVFVLSCSRSFVVSMADAVGESHLRGIVDRTLRQVASLTSVTQDNNEILVSMNTDAWKMVSNVFRRVSDKAVANLLESLRRMLRNASLSVICGAVLAAAEVQLTNHMVDSIEAEIVMSLSIQNMSYIAGNRIKNVIAALNSVSNFAAFLVDVIERTTRSISALRSAVKLPAVMLVYIASQRLQNYFASSYSLSQTELKTLSSAYSSVTFSARIDGSSEQKPQQYSAGGSGNAHALELFELPLDDGCGAAKNFIEVDAFLLASAMEDEDHHYEKTINSSSVVVDASTHTSSSAIHANRVALSGVLSNCLEAPAYLASPHHGIALLLHVYTESRSFKTDCGRLPSPEEVQTTNPTSSSIRFASSSSWVPALGATVEWPPITNSLQTLKVLLTSFAASSHGDVVSHQRLSVMYAAICEDLLLRKTSANSSGGGISSSSGLPLENPSDGVAVPSVTRKAEFVKMPRITQKIIEDRKLLDSLRHYGLELDIVKACVLADAVLATQASAACSLTSFKTIFSQHWLTSVLSTVEDVVLRLTALWCNHTTELSDRELAEIKSTAVRMESLVASTPASFVNLSESISRHGRKPGRVTGAETILRRTRITERSMNRSDLARNAEPFSVLNNAISVKRKLIDRPMQGASSEENRKLFSSNRDDGFGLFAFRVEFRNVSKSFGHRNVLVNVSFIIEAGTFVGIVGVSGAGKTTILQLLLRIFDPDQGEIRINDLPIAEFSIRMLRRRVAYVCQDFKENGFFREATISSNLAIGDISHEDMDGAIAQALELADATQVVEAKPLGIDTLPEAKLFSGGEIQRLVIARAQMRKPASTGLIILDEATSALDGATEQIVMSNLKHRNPQQQQHLSKDPPRRSSPAATTLNRTSTCIAVAHRLATLIEADQILVLDEGRIVEQGTWDDLVRVDGGLFQKLYTLQMVRGEDEPRPTHTTKEVKGPLRKE